MKEMNPFNVTFDIEQDTHLVAKAVEGDKKALNDLLKRHNSFIYNIAIKMLGSPPDAQDVTQDILIRLVTNLSRYDASKAQFRTWLYRMAFNYILNYKKSKTEDMIVGFDMFFDFVDEVSDDPSSIEDGQYIYSTETKIKCMTGMLMCVPREDRLLYILGDLFDIDHNLGAELFDVSKANFRKKLSRIRNNLRQWMNNRCGLINKDNPCRCSRKTKGFIEQGIVDPDNLIWDKNYTSYIKDYSTNNLEEIQKSSDKIYSQLYKEHPFKEDLTADGVLKAISEDDNMSRILDL